MALGVRGIRHQRVISLQPVEARHPNNRRHNVTDTIDSTSDQRTVNNVMRHKYKVLSDEEKAQMSQIKDAGLAFHDLLERIGNSREISLAKTKIEEAVMWAVKHITK